MRVTEKTALGIAVFIAGLCSIIYELLISTTSSYFLGDSVKQFSLTIGVYMAAMGVGSYLSKYLISNLLKWFIWTEVLLGLVGGASVPILYALFYDLTTGQYQTLVLVLIFVIGLLTGFEIPLLTRIMKRYYPLKTNLANVLSLDYTGALAATLLFPFLLLPFFGLFKTSIAFGLINIAQGFAVYWYFRKPAQLHTNRTVVSAALVLVGGLILLLVFSRQLLDRWESAAYSHTIIHAEQTPYQNLVVTKNQDEHRLYLNRVIQFSSRDEYRYHEALALLPAGQFGAPKSVLILGGGEGLLAREVLRLASVEEVVIVDLDERVFHLAEAIPALKKLNDNALDDPRVRKVADDASLFLRHDTSTYDLILTDLPDPSNEAVARLYSTFFFKLAGQRLSPNGIFATQAGSPFHTRKAFWCIEATLRASNFQHVLPYHVYVPSFGEWGFVMASNLPFTAPRLPRGLVPQFLEPDHLEPHFHFAPDIRKPDVPIAINRLDQPVLLDYFLAEWQTWRKEKTN